MKHQKGAALIVVLSLLTISLMVGLSSIQSSQINEKLSANYKAQAETVMNAETGLSAFFSQYQECNEIKGAIDAGFLSPDGGDEYELGSASTVDVNIGHFDIYMLGFSDNRIARAMVKAEGSCEVPLSFLRSRGAFVCPVGACGFQQGASVNGGISGFDHSLEDATSCNKYARDDQDRQDRAGAIFTDTDFSSQGYTEEDIDHLNVEGDPNYLATIDSDGDGIIDVEHVDAFFNASYMSDLLDASSCSSSDNECRSGLVVDAMKEVGRDAQAIMDAVEKGAISGDIEVVNAGEEFTVDGRHEGVILLNGGKLVLKGNSCVVGAVVGRGDAEAESTIESSGKPSIIGAVISDGSLSFAGKGRPDVSFSSEVLLALDEKVNLTINDFYFVGWEDYSGGMEWQ